jgi:hypothetical protein
MKLVKICLAGICLVAVAGCGKKQNAAPLSPAEYTNSLRSELSTQIKVANFAYAYGKAEATIQYEREKAGTLFNSLNAPEHSQADLERQVTETFWMLQTNPAARARVNSDQ